MILKRIKFSALNLINVLVMFHISFRHANSFKRILLVSYRSSGSSFVGNLIQQTNSSFYFYEPFREVVGKDYRYDYNKSLTALNAMDNIFSCASDVFTARYWMNGELVNLMSENVAYQNACRRSSSKEACNQLGVEMQMECMFAKHVIIKTVRLPMEYVAWYYESNVEQSNNTLAVVYLVRDPHAVMNSRKKRDWCVNNDRCMSTVDLCADMRDDYQVFRDMKAAYPNNFFLATFEELATETDMETRRLFKQLKIPFDVNVKNFIQVHTKGAFNRMMPEIERNTIRESEAVATKWKTEMKSDEAFFIDHFCYDVMDEIDYQVHNRKSIK